MKINRRTWILRAPVGMANAAMTGDDFSGVRALAFDVFGTVVDWRSTVIREGEALGRARGLEVDWAAFAEAWRDGYHPAMNRVRQGELPWMSIDALHRMNLDELLGRFGIRGLREGEKNDFNRVWHRLDPWPDSVAGLARLKAKFTLTTLSNGNVALLVNMAKRAGLPWDAVLSSELVGHYKPDREVYQKAASLLGLRRDEVMMVAAHKPDLRAAARAGLRTAFVPRPMEWPDRRIDLSYDDAFDVNASDFLDLAAQLDA